MSCFPMFSGSVFFMILSKTTDSWRKGVPLIWGSFGHFPSALGQQTILVGKQCRMLMLLVSPTQCELFLFRVVVGKTPCLLLLSTLPVVKRTFRLGSASRTTTFIWVCPEMGNISEIIIQYII